MTFNSADFALFCLIVGPLYFLLNCSPRLHRLQNLVLLAASYFFYGSWDHRFLSLIVLSTAVDYSCGLGVAQRRLSASSAVALSALYVVSSVLLLAPINWSAVAWHALPSRAYEGGWQLPPADYAIILRDGSWRLVWAALAVACAFAALFSVGFRLSGARRRKYFLIVSIGTNLALLGFFKYFDFFAEGAQRLVESLGLGSHQWMIGIIVPVGISFYTFQTMSYAIDVYRGDMDAIDDFVDFALFVSFFPQLVAGPIERAHALTWQLQRHRPARWSDMQVGTFLIGWGLYKKIFIADNLARFVHLAYDPGAEPTGPQILVATYAFAWQIYCDFSAYSDIARGVARWMGVDLMLNFNLPYAARNPSDFWRRWHISLSTFLRDYLYIPLGGNKGTAWDVYRNLMITMVLGGLWHGARANFVLWGLYQGLLLAIHRLIRPALERWSPRGVWSRRVWDLAAWIVFFHLVCYGWLLFRADTLEMVSHLTGALATGWSTAGDNVGVLVRLVWFLWMLVVVQICQNKSGNLLAPLTWPIVVRVPFYLMLFYFTVIWGAFDAVEFIYFQF